MDKMKVCVLASGSKGNCVYVETREFHLLLDIGTSCLHTEKKLREIGVEPSSIDFIFITHTHVDHIAGLRVFTKKYHPTVYLLPDIYDELSNMILGPTMFIDGDFSLGSLSVSCIRTSHDAPFSVGYILEEGEKSLVYITDTGYIAQKNFSKLKGKNVYIMESNHDVEMLLHGTYPYATQQRILGDKGHLSNEQSAVYMKEFVTKDTKQIILAHLSHENNTEEKALAMYKDIFSQYQKHLPSMLIAKQDEKTEVVEV